MPEKNCVFTAARDELNAIKELILENKLSSIFILCIFIGGLYYVDPFPGRAIRLAASGQDSGYALIAQSQALFLKEKGINLSVQNSNSSIQSAQLLASSQDGVNAAFIQGGVLDPDLAERIQSLGSVDFEPVWIFYRKGLAGHPERLKDLSRYRVGVGPSQSGTWIISKKLFSLNGIDIASNPHFKVGSYEDNLADLLNGKLDVVINVNPVIDPVVNRLLHDPKIELFELTHAAAYDKQLPFLKVVTLPAASIDVAKQIPLKDISLLATTTNLAVSKNMHPSLQTVLLMAAKNVQRGSSRSFLSDEEQFPAYIDRSIPISEAATRFYDYGVPATIHYFPFWLAGFIDRTWIYILTLFAILYPLSYLNLNLRSIRFRMRIERIQRELIFFSIQLEDPILSVDQRTAISNRIEQILIMESKLYAPSGSEGEYLDFLTQLHEMRARAQ